MTLIKGKRYEWTIWKGIWSNKSYLRNGLFTGEFLSNGNGIFIEKDGTRWAVPEEEVREYKKK